MVAKTKSSRANAINSRSSTLAMAVVGAVWVALLWSSAAEARRNINRNVYAVDYERYLKDSKKGKSMKQKSCKSGKAYKNYYGYYDHCFEEVEIDQPDGNSTDVDEDMIEEEKSYKSKGSKGSKGGYYSKSDKKKSKSKSDKKSKSKSDKKSDKSCKKSKKSNGCDDEEEEEPVDSGYTPTVSWNTTFPDAIDTGFLFYDKVTKFAWYAYTAKAGAQEVVSVSSAAAVDGSIATVKTEVVEASSSTIGKICPLDIAIEGKVKSELCIEIKPPEEWKNATSTKIVAAEVCHSAVNDSILKMAVAVEDTSKVLHLDPTLVGSRMIVYDIVIGGKAGGDAIIVEVPYEGWKSLYGEPGINGQPAFTPDCKNVFASWLSPMDLDSAGEIDVVDSTTIATKVEFKTAGSAEIWRLGTSGRLAGLTSTKDGKSLISAANIPEEDTLNVGGIVKLDVSTGQIQDQFIWPSNSLNLPHNAFTNPVLDEKGFAYYVDSLLGLVKFEGDDLDDGPVWSAVGGYYRQEDFLAEQEETEEEKTEAEEKAEVKEITAQTKLMIPENEIDVRRLRMLMEEEEGMFTAFQPALDESDFATIYGCGMTTRGDQYDGVIALAANNGDRVWHTKFMDHHVVNVGSCRGITDDVVWGPSNASSTGDAIYIARDDVIQALDAKNGTSLWKYHMDGPGSTKFVVISDTVVIAANTGLVQGLNTLEPLPPDNTTKVPTPAPTPSPNKPTPMPSRKTLPPVPPPTAAPEKASASARGLSYFATVLAALPLLLALLR